MPEIGVNLETELLTTFVVRNFWPQARTSCILQTARHRASRRLWTCHDFCLASFSTMLIYFYRVRLDHDLLSQCSCLKFDFSSLRTYFACTDFSSRVHWFSRHDFHRMSFLVCWWFVRVSPLLIGLACMDCSRLVSHVAFHLNLCFVDFSIRVHWFVKT